MRFLRAEGEPDAERAEWEGWRGRECLVAKMLSRGGGDWGKEDVVVSSGMYGGGGAEYCAAA